MHFPLIELIQGILIGILISIPLGPVGLIVMKRTAEFGLRAGILSGLAIVLIDSIAAVVILTSLHNSIPFLHQLPIWVHIIGGTIIFFYGLRTALTNPTLSIEVKLPWHKHFFTAAAIALTNPSTYFSFGIIALLLSRFMEKSIFDRIEVAVGFFVGAFLWWCVLAFVAFSQRKRYLNAQYLHRIIGIIIMALSLFAFFSHFW
jgi:threonine/homoserine/homoserine lactone efflux protein